MNENRFSALWSMNLLKLSRMSKNVLKKTIEAKGIDEVYLLYVC